MHFYNIIFMRIIHYTMKTHTDVILWYFFRLGKDWICLTAPGQLLQSLIYTYTHTSGHIHLDTCTHTHIHLDTCIQTHILRYIVSPFWNKFISLQYLTMSSSGRMYSLILSGVLFGCVWISAESTMVVGKIETYLYIPTF